MVIGSRGLTPRKSAEFVESSVLEAIVPASSHVDLKDELQSWDGVNEDETGSILPFIAQRNVLLLDELLPVYVVFRTPLPDNETLQPYLARLVVNLEAFAFSTAPVQESEPKAGPTKELIYSTTIKDTDQPTTIRHGEEDDAHTYVIWKVEVYVARPQGRFHKPAVYFQPAASFKPVSAPKQTMPEDDYLPSRIPTAINLLQAFDSDPALTGVHPRLSAMRINKIVQSAAPVVKEMVRPIKNGQRPLFRVLPALVWRIRHARIHTSLSDLSLMASLDVEVASYATYDVRIKKVELALNGGEVKSFANIEDARMIYKPGDQITYLYKIKPDVASDGTPALGSKGHFLNLKISAEVIMSETCHPNIAVEWQTPIDFTTASEQTPNTIKAAHRLSTPALKAANPDALPSHDTQSQASEEIISNAINITLTISGPSKVNVGEIFTWEVFIVNRSDKIRKLAVLVIPKRKRDYEKHHSRPSTSSATPGSKSDKKELLACAVLDENIVYAKQKSARTETAELICLTTDIRLGQLAPGSCYTADLKFLPFSKGVLGVESIRVIDLVTNETADIRELPSIVSSEKDN
ncbi:TRAPP trafficking subunit Trs65-domain-containing protein [Phaeosphaeriaceae sp. PMI808]|nr:TRAPP trafficking subunit Trs65-domain-containing protein [Phaeosphaeriaceae sp. PMI808]